MMLAMRDKVNRDALTIAACGSVHFRNGDQDALLRQAAGLDCPCDGCSARGRKFPSVKAGRVAIRTDTFDADVPATERCTTTERLQRGTCLGLQNRLIDLENSFGIDIVALR